MRADLVLLAGSWLLTYLVHSTLLLSGIWLLSRRKRATPAVRDSLWKIGILGALITSTLQVGLGLEPLGGALALESRAPSATAGVAWVPEADSWKGQLVQSQEPDRVAGRQVGAARTAQPSSTHTPVIILPPAESGPASVEPATPRKAWFIPTVVGIWAVMGGSLLALYLLRRARAMREIGPRTAIEDASLLGMLESLRQAGEVRRNIRVTCAQGLGSPVALGSSEIVLPEAALTELDPEQQRSMLAHELAHLARRDPTWLALSCVIERVFFMQPLNRVARAGMQEAAELLCDDWAVHRTGSGFSLATCLVKVAEWVDTTPRPVPMAGMAEHRSQLVTRIHRLIEGRTMPTARRSLWLAAGAVVVLGVTAIAAPGVTTNHREFTDADILSLDPNQPEALAVIDAMASDTDTAVVRSEAPVATGGWSRLTSSVRALEARLAGTNRARMRADMARARAEMRAMSIAGVAPRAPRPPEPPAAIGWSGGPVVAPRALAYADAARWDSDRQRDTNNIAVPALIVALKDSDVEVRRAAANSLSNLDDPRAVPGLIDALKDSDAEVRCSAAHGLGSLEDKRAVPGLVALLKDGNKDVRQAALSALHSMPEQVPDEAILTAIGDSDPEVRSAAVGLALNRIQSNEDEDAKPDPRYVSAFARMLNDGSADTRQQAAEALGASHLKEAPAALMAASKDKNADVRQAVAGALGQIGDPRAVSTLKEMLSDASADVRESAVNGLSEIRDQSSLEALVGALKSSDAAVRRSAAEALGQRGD